MAVEAIVVDDCPVYARGLAAILRDEGFFVRRLPPGDFTATIPRSAGVVVFGSATMPDLLVLHTRSGVATRIARDSDVDILVTAVRAVAGGVSGTNTVLSPRERDVLGQIARGLTHGQIALLFGISPHTVDTYVKRIRAKLNLGNKAELTCAAVAGAQG